MTQVLGGLRACAQQGGSQRSLLEWRVDDERAELEWTVAFLNGEDPAVVDDGRRAPVEHWGKEGSKLCGQKGDETAREVNLTSEGG
jgi:hypothetical protein